MSSVRIPNLWTPRSYQRPLYNQFGHGRQYQRGSVIWHRRAGKDSTVLNLTAREMFTRVGTYWHLFPEQAQARKAIWNGIDGQGRRIIDQFLPPEARHEAAPKSEQEMLLRTATGSTWQLAGSDSYDSLVGSNPVGVVFSEWALANPAAWDYIRPILLENGGWALFITTPRGRNHAYQTHMTAMASDNWFADLRTVDDTGRITPEQIQEERDSGMSEAKVQQEYFCSFEASADEQFMPSDAVGEARKRPAHFEADDPIVIGVDCARFGDDSSVICIRRGFDARTVPPIILDNVDTMQLAGHVAAAMDQHNAAAVFIDEGGLGAGVVDRLRQMGRNVMGVNFGWSPDAPRVGVPKVADKRAEMWAVMREAVKSGLAIPDDNRLMFELLAPSYLYDANNAIRLESKKDMKKRGLKSPDIADALALTYAYPVLGVPVQQQLEQQATQDYDPFW